MNVPSIVCGLENFQRVSTLLPRIEWDWDAEAAQAIEDDRRAQDLDDTRTVASKGTDRLRKAGPWRVPREGVIDVMT